MFKKFTKERQLVDIVKTRSGAMYLTTNFKDEFYPSSPSFHKEPFKISGNENFIDSIHSIAKKHSKYKLKCRFDSPFGVDFIKQTTLEEYIPMLEKIIESKVELHKEFLEKNHEKFNYNTAISEIRHYYYAQTFEKILKKVTKNSLNTEFLPTEILMNEGGHHLSIIGPGMDGLGGYASAMVDLYELTRIVPRKKIVKMSTYVAKKINSGLISRIGSDFEMSSRNKLKEMEKEGRCVKVRGFPTIITFYSEIDPKEPLLEDFNKFYNNRK